MASPFLLLLRTGGPPSLSRKAWVSALAQSLTNCVYFGRLPHLSESQFTYPSISDLKVVEEELIEGTTVITIQHTVDADQRTAVSAAVDVAVGMIMTVNIRSPHAICLSFPPATRG